MPTPAAAPVPELSVLKPIDPSTAKTEDDYEIYTLSNAQVYYAGGRQGTLASLLDAYADAPLRVEGRLDSMERSKSKFLVKKPFRPVDIEITEVTRFSYGQTEDGDIVIWALGAAGWFELRPSRTYKAIFQDMVQAVEILYFVTDIYNQPRKRGGGPSAQLIFQEYAEDERFACNDAAEAQRIFSKHRSFLIMCFLNKAQGVAWSNTPLGQYFKRQFQRDYEIAKARVEGKYEQKEARAAKAEAAPSKVTTSKAKAKPQKKAQPDAPKKDDNWWEAAALFAFVQKAVNLGAMRVRHVTIDKVAKLLVKRYDITDENTARNVILVHAENLCYMMDHPRRKAIEFFRSEPIFEELYAGHNLTAAEVRHAEAVELKPRKGYSSFKEDMDSDSDSSSSSDVETPKRRVSRHKKTGTLSVLRPKTSKFLGKGKSVKAGKWNGKAPTGAVTEDSDEEGVESGSDIAVDTPTQALSPGKRKRGTETTDFDPRKRVASPPADPEAESPSNSPSEDQEAPQVTLPLQWRPRNLSTTKSSSPAVLPAIISSPLPTYEANGPGGSWICTFDGCSQKIYGASTELGRSLIHEHFQDHAKGRHKEVAILLREEQKLRLPVNNLIKRIREMSELQQPLFPPAVGQGGTTVRLSPIERMT